MSEPAGLDGEARFRTLADHIAQLAWMADASGWIFWYNERWFEYTGTDLSAHYLEAAGHDLEVDLAGGPMPLDADATRLSQVFSNLLHNAARYTPRGGTIRIETERGGGTGSGGGGAREASVRVIDSGAGLTDEARERVFEMFYQGERASAPATAEDSSDANGAPAGEDGGLTRRTASARRGSGRQSTRPPRRSPKRARTRSPASGSWSSTTTATPPTPSKPSSASAATARTRSTTASRH